MIPSSGANKWQISIFLRTQNVIRLLIRLLLALCNFYYILVELESVVLSEELVGAQVGASRLLLCVRATLAGYLQGIHSLDVLLLAPESDTNEIWIAKLLSALDEVFFVNLVQILLDLLVLRLL